ncbi:hypothetical protein ANN_07236 [Periplaneta americana]|uniref:Uncharacterized protein n=1 Tax=Periplaneta americana TaxID=6978 RepID=A0ABQ8TH20_PERAM|nr:hypothetical protein ANN_07236 [Periplaneta americana]
MAGLCEGGYEPSGSLKAIYSRCAFWDEKGLLSFNECENLLLLLQLQDYSRSDWASNRDYASWCTLLMRADETSYFALKSVPSLTMMNVWLLGDKFVPHYTNLFISKGIEAPPGNSASKSLQEAASN